MLLCSCIGCQEVESLGNINALKVSIKFESDDLLIKVNKVSKVSFLTAVPPILVVVLFLI